MLLPRKCSSIIEYSPTTTTTTLDVDFIASQTAPVIAAAEAATDSIYSACVFRVELNSAQSHSTNVSQKLIPQLRSFLKGAHVFFRQTLSPIKDTFNRHYTVSWPFGDITHP